MAEVVSGISDSVVISVLFSALAVFSDAPDVWQAQKVISAAMGAIRSERIAVGSDSGGGEEAFVYAAEIIVGGA